MAAPAVAAVAKKVIVAILTDPKARKKVFGIILGIILILLLPIAAVVCFLSGDIEVDTDRLQTLIEQNLTAEQQARLQAVEDTMLDIEDAMIAVGYSDARVKEAQVLFTLALYDYAEQDGFTDKLVGCFTAEQTDEQLIAAVNTAFGTTIDGGQFINVMNGIRKTYIDTSGYTDPLTKNNLDLVLWATRAAENEWGYVYGTYGTVLTDTLLESKAAQYPDEVGGNEEYIRQTWLGGRTADCVGLIKGYSWYDTENRSTEIGINDMPDIGADTMYENAAEKGTIDTIPEVPGLAVWHDGHIGIYIGNGEVVQAASTTVGVIRNNLADTVWTHWLKVPYISYLEQEEN